MFGQQVLQLRLLDRRNVIVDLLDKGRIGIDADDVVALGGKHGDDRRTELSQADNRDFHPNPSTGLARTCRRAFHPARAPQWDDLQRVHRRTFLCVYSALAKPPTKHLLYIRGQTSGEKLPCMDLSPLPSYLRGH